MKRLLSDSQNTFYCFSAPVMLATFLIEYGLAAYVWVRYKASPLRQMIILMLLLLGTFQVAEYHICTTSPTDWWTLIGVTAITFLPPAGLHVVSLFTKKTFSVQLSYLIALAYVLAFAFVPGALTSGVCGGNYVILHVRSVLGLSWGIYYFAYLFLALWQSWDYLRKNPKKPGNDTLSWLIIGYTSFMLPMGIAYLASPESRSAVPSIMCGFAVIFAVILGLRIMHDQPER